jgi:hypothetical protein
LLRAHDIAANKLHGLIAIAAAYALVLQTLVLAFGWCPYAALGAGTGVICSAHASADPSQGQPAPADGGVFSCCSMMCCEGVALIAPKLESLIAPPAFWTQTAPRIALAWRAPPGSAAPILPFAARAPPQFG